jgi:hypothetical protein
MRRLTITLSLALGLIASLVLAAAIGARPFDPPSGPVVAGGPPCPNVSASSAVVPGGVYRAMVSELRQQGYSRTQIQAEIGDALVVLGSARADADGERCSTKP